MKKTKAALEEIAKEGIEELDALGFLNVLELHKVTSPEFFAYMRLAPRDPSELQLKKNFFNIACTLRFHERQKDAPNYKGMRRIDQNYEFKLPKIKNNEEEEDTKTVFNTISKCEVKKRGRKPGRCYPNPVVTQIGSLPYDNIEKAIEYSMKHDIPFLPELPKLGDAMMEYIKNPGSLSCLEEFAKRRFKRVKIQCVGPATLIQAGHEESELWRPEAHIHKLFEKINAEEVILFLDEPFLGHASTNFSEWWQRLFEICDRETIKEIYKKDMKVIKGVHTCYAMNWTTLFYNRDLDIISFDASKFGAAFISQGYEEFRARGGRIAWGIRKLEDIPLLDGSTAFRKGDLITAPCGLGGMNLDAGKNYTEEDCENYLNMMRDVRDKLKNGC